MTAEEYISYMRPHIERLREFEQLLRGIPESLPDDCRKALQRAARHAEIARRLCESEMTLVDSGLASDVLLLKGADDD